MKSSSVKNQNKSHKCKIINKEMMNKNIKIQIKIQIKLLPKNNINKNKNKINERKSTLASRRLLRGRMLDKNKLQMMCFEIYKEDF